MSEPMTLAPFDLARAIAALLDNLDEADKDALNFIIAQARRDGAREALTLMPDEAGRIMHDTWTATKRAQGFHHPRELSHDRDCPKCHRDLIPWDELPEPQKDINRNAFGGLLAALRARADA